MLRTLRRAINPLRRAVNLQTRLVSSNGKLGELATIRRTRYEIILLFRKIIGFLEHAPDPENFLGYINKELDNTLPNVRSPQVVYERVISFLVSRKYAQEAILLFQRMHEAGLMSPSNLDAKMLAMALAVPHNSPHDYQPLIRRLTLIFTDPSYTEKNFLGLLKTMAKYEVDKAIIYTIVDIFISTRGPNYIIRPELLAPLLNAQTRFGDVDLTLEVLDQYYSGADKLNRSARASLRAPYVQVLAPLRETRTWDSASIKRILNTMTAQGLSLDLTTLNILLSREVRLGNHQSAFAIYSMLKGMKKTKKISPDSFTFGSMFLLYRMMLPRIVRKHHRKDLASPFPPRALYHDFMLAANPKGNVDRIVPSSTLMNVILRAFIRQRDYAGAFVVINSFSRFNIPLDHRTYYRIIKHVVRRIWLEVSKRYSGWSVMFLGVPDYRHVELNEDLVQNLFAFVSRGTFHLISPFYAFRRNVPPTNEDCRYKLPSMEMMQSVLFPDPQDFYYDPVPLKRILRRAILATLRIADHNAGPAEVSKAIADAKVDMLPKTFQHRHSPASMDVRRDEPP